MQGRTTMTAKSPAVPTQPTMTGVAQTEERTIKEQVVLVLQGGGALGAYQAGVYQALMEGGIKPDWVIGTSIGAINGAIIAGNEAENRIATRSPPPPPPPPQPTPPTARREPPTHPPAAPPRGFWARASPRRRRSTS